MNQPASTSPKDQSVEQVFDGAHDAMALVDAAGLVLRINRRFSRLFGFRPEEILGRPLDHLIRTPQLTLAPQAVLAGHTRPVGFETVRSRRDGSPIRVSVQVRDAAVTLSDGTRGIPVAYLPVERVATEQALKTSEERRNLLDRGANDGLWDWDLKTGEIHYSARWKTLLGYADDEIKASPDEWMVRVHPDDVDSLKQAIARHLENGSEHLAHEHRVRHRNGDYRWTLARGVAARDASGVAYRMAGSLTDITIRKRMEAQLLHEERHDPLTGLANRAVFLRALDRHIRQATRPGEHPVAVLFLDLDRFTVINDSLGHDIGDQVLVALAARLQECVRPGDLVARLGGDQFLVLLAAVKETADTIRVSERIQAALGAPFRFGGEDIFVSTSIGITVGLTPEDRPEHLLRDAHTAAQRAKTRGRARYEMFDPGMHARGVARLQLETDLRRAIERHELRARYQPIVALDTRRITGFEALVRWDHPQRGLLSPAEFIPVAEDTGLVVPLGWWMLGEACRQVRSWHDRFPELQLSVSVNVSPRQFQQEDLGPRLAEVVREAGLPPASLKLEITEGVLMDDPESAFGLIERLRGDGVRVNIDDFGTGYSSLSYLHRLRVDGLKIDRSFVAGLGGQSGTTEIVKAIATLASSLGLEAIAEGVETEAQALELHALGCGYAQGYLFEHPVDAEAATALLSS